MHHEVENAFSLCRRLRVGKIFVAKLLVLVDEVTDEIQKPLLRQLLFARLWIRQNAIPFSLIDSCKRR